MPSRYKKRTERERAEEVIWLVRGIPTALHDALRIQALKEKRAYKYLLMDATKDYLDSKKEK